jgi:organic radical activating enzyme
MTSIAIFFGLALAFIIGMLSSRKTSQDAATVLDLSQKIKDNQAKNAAAQKTANEAVEDYQNELKKYDPKFYTDGDDGDGKPSA